MTEPPLAPTESHVRTLHGTATEDPWFWMRDPHDDRLAGVLASEKAWTETVCAGEADLRETLFTEIKGRVKETDLSVPVRRGAWWYQARTFEGRAYPVHGRIAVRDPEVLPGDDDPFEVILDANVVAEGHEYSQIGGAAVSPDARLLAWSVDHSGDESYTLHLRDLDTGVDRDETVEGVSYPLAWSADSRFVFYTTLDAIQRPWRVWRHELGSPQSTDAVVFEEPDERFFVGVESNRSDDWILITSNSAVSGETWLLDAHDPTGSPACIAPRVPDVEYGVEATPDRLFILTNADGAEDFALFFADPHELSSPCRVVIPPTDGVRLEGVEAFASHVVVHLRSGGTTGVTVLDATGAFIRDIELPEVIGTVSGDANPEFVTDHYRFTYESLVTPPSLFTERLDSGERTLLKAHEVLGGYDPASFISERVWVEADDGTKIPVSVVRLCSTPIDGTAPCMIYGYGAYEISMDPWFSAARLSLLERGWVYAIAHVRGGGEMGRHWYTDGKFAAKANSFTDFVACARHLIDAGYTAADRLVARGGSAGGLLVGAAVNLAPELFAAAIAEVPFVDPLNTLLDPSLPLTVTEWEEWGNPLEDPDAFATIQRYSPYENIQGVPYPAILAVTGIEDPRVGVHEPLKWIQRLRATTTGDRPIVVKIDDAGHGGASGRYEAWRDEAFVLAFALSHVAT